MITFFIRNKEVDSFDEDDSNRDKGDDSNDCWYQSSIEFELWMPIIED